MTLVPQCTLTKASATLVSTKIIQSISYIRHRLICRRVGTCTVWTWLVRYGVDGFLTQVVHVAAPVFQLNLQQHHFHIVTLDQKSIGYRPVVYNTHSGAHRWWLWILAKDLSSGLGASATRKQEKMPMAPITSVRDRRSDALKVLEIVKKACRGECRTKLFKAVAQSH